MYSLGSVFGVRGLSAALHRGGQLQLSDWPADWSSALQIYADGHQQGLSPSMLRVQKRVCAGPYRRLHRILIFLLTAAVQSRQNESW